MRWLLELLSTMDYISPTVGMVQDAVHKGDTLTIQVNKGDLSKAKKLLGSNVVSSNMVAFDSTADITIKCYGGEDGYGSIRSAIETLKSKGIDVSVYGFQ